MKHIYKVIMELIEYELFAKIIPEDCSFLSIDRIMCQYHYIFADLRICFLHNVTKKCKRTQASSSYQRYVKNSKGKITGGVDQ